MSNPHDASSHGSAPGLPEITDEAGETPSWVPVLGAVLFVLMVASVWWAHRQHEALEDGSTPTTEQP